MTAQRRSSSDLSVEFSRAIDREKVLLAAQGYIQKKRYDRAVAEYQKIIQAENHNTFVPHNV